jgi:hypothetical protein
MVAAGSFLATPAQAGMPKAPLTAEDLERYIYLSLTDPTRERLQAISFFVAGALVCSFGFQLVWNTLRGEIPRLPRLGFGRAVCAVTILGLAAMVVLIMISGARELLTPGAWVQNGATYRLAKEVETKTGQRAPSTVHIDAAEATKAFEQVRRARLEHIYEALSRYAHEHEGHFPASKKNLNLPKDDWMPTGGTLEYRYRPGLSMDDAAEILVREPLAYDDWPLVVYVSGKIEHRDPADLIVPPYENKQTEP